MARKSKGVYRKIKRINQKQLDLTQNPEKAAKYKKFGRKSIVCSVVAVASGIGLPFLSARLSYLGITRNLFVAGNILCFAAALLCLLAPIYFMTLSAAYCSAQRRTNKLSIGKTALTMTLAAALAGLALLASMTYLAYSAQFA